MPRFDSNMQLTIVHYAADKWEHVCPIIRVTGPAEQAGWKVMRGNEWENDQIKVFPEKVAEADLVVIQRDFPRYSDEYQAVLAEARVRQKTVVYDVDDLLTELPDTHPDMNRYMSVRASILAAIVEADVVTCTTPDLETYLRQFNPNTRAVPNYLNDRLWNNLRLASIHDDQALQRPVVIGYLGASSHVPDLAMITPILKRILDKYGKDVLLRLWGITTPVSLHGYENVESLDVGLVSYAEFSAYYSRQECDLVIAPLLDNSFNRCKSSLKFLEYASIGAPGVFSKLSPYEKVVKHGENGYLASNPEKWETYLSALIEQPDLRRKMGQVAQDTLCRDWLLSQQIGQWIGAYQEIYSSGKTAPRPEGELRLVKKFHGWDRQVQAEMQLLRDKLAEQEQALASSAAEMSYVKDQLRLVNQDLFAITHSQGWYMLEFLYRVRLKMAPRGSRRENLMSLGVHTPSILRNEGIRPWGRHFKSSLHRREPQRPQGSKTELISFVQKDAEPCPVPAISVVIERNAALPLIDEQAVLDWVHQQTLSPVEVVLWDRAAQMARNLEGEERVWLASTVAALRTGLRAKYLCMASSDLLQQVKTYLEENLLALEGEGLIFTVNTVGSSGWATRLLQTGRLPGSRLLPLFRMVVNKDYIGNSFSLDLDPLLDGGQESSRVAGKVITHPTAKPEVGASFPMETFFGAVDACFSGRYIVIRAKGEDIWQPTMHALSPNRIQELASPVASDLPTVMVVMPFLAVGGAEQHTLKVMLSLKDKIRFVMITLEELSPVLGTTVDAFRQATPLNYTFPDILNDSLYLSLMDYLFDRYAPEAIYVANGASWFYDALPEIKKRHPNARVINHVYDSKVGWINRYDKELAANLDGHIAVNSRIFQAYVQRGARENQVYMIDAGIDPKEFDPEDYPPERQIEIKRRLGLPLDKKIVTLAARVHPQKRPLDFVELARRYVNDPSVAFLMVGDGPLAADVDSLLEKLKLTNFYRLPFYRPLADIWSITDVMVLPSDFEGMPMVIIEAQAMGKPVVVTDVGNNRDVINITKGGVVIDKIGDVSALMNGVRQVLQNPPDPARLRQIVLEHYDIDLIAEKYRQAFFGK